jgi:hypothetical protein
MLQLILPCAGLFRWKQWWCVMPRTKFLMHGAVIARLLLDIFQTIMGGMELAGAPDPSCTDIILLCAVMIGHAEGRPMTAAKLAEYVGIARPTAIRHLQELMANGVINQDAGKRWKLRTSDQDRRDLIDSVIVASTQHIRKAMAALSKMDGQDIASHYDTGLRTARGDAK